MPEVVKAKAAIPIGSNHPRFYSSGPEVIGYKHISNARLLPFQLERWEDPIAWLGVGSLLHP
jgi:hypothetical protein